MATPLFPVRREPATELRRCLDADELLRAPGCYDALTARVLEQAGHQAAFVSGFAVAAARIGLPDVGLLSYGEILDQTRAICDATTLPVIGDADTGYGNGVNAQRTFAGYARAGVACVMVEDQRWPKQCGHTAGKDVVDRAEAVERVAAMAAMREELGVDVLIMARTDAAAAESFDEALWRTQAFVDAGADLTFLEAPESEAQMARYCETVPGWKTANIVEDGRTPWLSPEQLADLGYAVALYPLSLLLRGLDATRAAAGAIGSDDPTTRAGFDDVRAAVGWPDYDRRRGELAAGTD